MVKRILLQVAFFEKYEPRVEKRVANSNLHVKKV